MLNDQAPSLRDDDEDVYHQIMIEISGQCCGRGSVFLLCNPAMAVSNNEI